MKVLFEHNVCERDVFFNMIVIHRKEEVLCI